MVEKKEFHKLRRQACIEVGLKDEKIVRMAEELREGIKLSNFTVSVSTAMCIEILGIIGMFLAERFSHEQLVSYLVEQKGGGE